MILPSAIVILSAFLLFLVQPMVARLILPSFGGSAAVWTGCMLFFQSGLLLGYFYADRLVRFKRLGYRNTLHILLLLLSVMALFNFRIPEAQGVVGSSPVISILLYLSASIGVPYFILSSTAPLIQSLLSKERAQGLESKSVYRLYAISNLGSFVALFLYPLVIEPGFDVSVQISLWKAGFLLFVLLSIIFLVRHGVAQTDRSAGLSIRELTYSELIKWIGLSAGGVVLLLSFTNQLCQNVASVPFLWVLPLACYLLSYIVAFRFQWLYKRGAYLVLFVTLALLSFKSLSSGTSSHFGFLLLQASLLLFIGCAALHFELERSKPDPKRLTIFYLMTSLGGVIGGLFVALLAPRIYTNYGEFNLSIVLVPFCLVSILMIEQLQRVNRTALRITLFGVSCLGVLLLSLADSINTPKGLITQERNFYGVVSITEKNPQTEKYHYYQMHHGAVVHGVQFREQSKRLTPTSYYGEDSGIGLMLRYFRTNKPRRIGVVGLGVGTLASYASKDDKIVFYEINPLVIDFAKQYFSFLSDGLGKVEIVDGDARLKLEESESEAFDILVIDAFSGDSIPLHLLTKEALMIYLRHLAPGGAIVLHISNMHLDLVPVVVGLGRSVGIEPLFVSDQGVLTKAQRASLYAVLPTDVSQLDSIELRDRLKGAKSDLKLGRVWSDQYSAVIEALRW